MSDRSATSAENPRITSEAWRAAYWTGLLVAIGLLVGPAAGGLLPGESPFDLPTVEPLLWAALAVSLVVAAITAALGSGMRASVANPVAVVLAAVLVAVHGVLSGTTVPDLSPVGMLVLDATALVLAAIAGVAAHLVGFAIGSLVRRVRSIRGGSLGTGSRT